MIYSISNYFKGSVLLVLFFFVPQFSVFAQVEFEAHPDQDQPNAMQGVLLCACAIWRSKCFKTYSDRGVK